METSSDHIMIERFFRKSGTSPFRRRFRSVLKGVKCKLNTDKERYKLITVNSGRKSKFLPDFEKSKRAAFVTFPSAQRRSPYTNDFELFDSWLPILDSTGGFSTLAKRLRTGQVLIIIKNTHSINAEALSFKIMDELPFI